MIIQEDDSSALYQIQRYEPGSIWINQHCYQSSVIVKAHQLIAPWEPSTIKELHAEHFTPLFSPRVDIVLLGTGRQLIIPEQSLLAALFERGIGVEFMDSRAACYTYTVLIAEERNVAACILII